VYLDTEGLLHECKIITNDLASFGKGESIYQEFFEPVKDPLILRYLALLSKLDLLKNFFQHRAWGSFEDYTKSLFYSFFNSIPPIISSGSAAFIPTGSLLLFEKLASYFPKHSLIMSDFDFLPRRDRTRGNNSPRVQSRYHGENVTATSYLAPRGLFDIFFATDFEVARKTYALTQKRSLDTIISHKHKHFMQLNSLDAAETTTKSGYNALVEEFPNVSFLLS
jgi:hypothetical protein